MEEKQKRPLKELPPTAYAPFERIMDKLRRNEGFSKEELEMRLVAEEVAQVLSWKKGMAVSPRYLSEMIRDGRLEPVASAGGHAYFYQLGQVLSIQFRKAGRPRKTGPEKA